MNALTNHHLTRLIAKQFAISTTKMRLFTHSTSRLNLASTYFAASIILAFSYVLVFSFLLFSGNFKVENKISTPNDKLA